MLQINNFYNGDTIEYMKQIDDKSIQLILTSPPYNASWRKDGHRYKNSGFSDNLTPQEYIDWSLNIFKQYQRILKDKGVVAYNLSYTVKYPELPIEVIYNIIKNTDLTLVDTIYWKKNNASPLSQSPNRITRIIEPVYIFAKKEYVVDFECNKEKASVSRTGQQYYKNYINFITAKNNDGKLEGHDAAYSTEFAKFFVDLYSFENTIVLDNFMGTGTTAIACKELNRNFIGIELFKDYYEYSIKRLQNYENTGQYFLKNNE